MTVWGRRPLLVAIPLWMSFESAAALTEQHICYMLDGILFVYGIVLTVLYCRLKISNARDVKAKEAKQKQNVAEAIYVGLAPHAQDTYETISVKK
ncbi:high affinity immunoglobulin epsilon receptor subunit gamma [Antennarius striatus]|uniref:high affinity immunoglobulin epsilon receptor subunit gamma n=1 Tax=Antennarius striatus TaxID=241820 RepID=UPI0035B2B507